MNKTILHQCIYYSPAAQLRKLFLKRSHGVILAYHRVMPRAKENDVFRDLLVEPDYFERQIAYLVHNYEVVSLTSFIESLTSRNKPGKPRAVITFDDAYADNYEYAYPVLRKYNLPATIFVPTAFIETGKSFWWDALAGMLNSAKVNHLDFLYQGRRLNLILAKDGSIEKAFHSLARLFKRSDDKEKERFLNSLSDNLGVKTHTLSSKTLSWDRIKEMSRHGITFGAHTHTHCAVSCLAPDRINEELFRPKEILESHLAQEVNFFAYPYGEKDDFSLTSRGVIKDCGYKAALTMIQQPVFFDSDIYTLPRIGIGDDADISFKLKLNGVIPFFTKQ